MTAAPTNEVTPEFIEAAKRAIAELVAVVLGRYYRGEISVDQIPREIAIAYGAKTGADVDDSVKFVNMVMDLLGCESRCYVQR